MKKVKLGKILCTREAISNTGGNTADIKKEVMALNVFYHLRHVEACRTGLRRIMQYCDESVANV